MTRATLPGKWRKALKVTPHTPPRLSRYQNHARHTQHIHHSVFLVCFTLEEAWRKMAGFNAAPCGGGFVSQRSPGMAVPLRWPLRVCPPCWSLAFCTLQLPSYSLPYLAEQIIRERTRPSHYRREQFGCFCEKPTTRGPRFAPPDSQWRPLASGAGGRAEVTAEAAQVLRTTSRSFTPTRLQTRHTEMLDTGH